MGQIPEVWTLLKNGVLVVPTESLTSLGHAKPRGICYAEEPATPKNRRKRKSTSNTRAGNPKRSKSTTDTTRKPKAAAAGKQKRRSRSVVVDDSKILKAMGSKEKSARKMRPLSRQSDSSESEDGEKGRKKSRAKSKVRPRKKSLVRPKSPQPSESEAEETVEKKSTRKGGRSKKKVEKKVRPRKSVGDLKPLVVTTDPDTVDGELEKSKKLDSAKKSRKMVEKPQKLPTPKDLTSKEKREKIKILAEARKVDYQVVTPVRKGSRKKPEIRPFSTPEVAKSKPKKDNFSTPSANRKSSPDGFTTPSTSKMNTQNNFSTPAGFSTPANSIGKFPNINLLLLKFDTF